MTLPRYVQAYQTADNTTLYRFNPPQNLILAGVVGRVSLGSVQPDAYAKAHELNAKIDAWRLAMDTTISRRSKLSELADDYFEKTMSEIAEPVETVYEKESVESVLNRFTKNRSHIFIVKDDFGGTSGIVTLEDCIETLLGVEIVDESDEVADMRKLAKDQLRQQRRIEENGNS